MNTIDKLDVIKTVLTNQGLGSVFDFDGIIEDIRYKDTVLADYACEIKHLKAEVARLTESEESLRLNEDLAFEKYLCE